MSSSFEGILVICVIFGLAAGLGDDWNCYIGNVALASNAMLILILLPVLTVMGFKLRKYPADGRYELFLKTIEVNQHRTEKEVYDSVREQQKKMKANFC